MTSVTQAFIDNPTVEAFHRLTKDQLLEVATTFQIELTSAEKRLKHTVKSVILPYLVEKGILPPVDLKDTIRLKELSIKEKELDNEREELRLKASQNELELRRLEVKAIEENMDLGYSASFDISKHIKLVPPFVEKDVDKYFPYFEKIAQSLKWPKAFWPLLIQSVLSGRAQEVYSSLSVEQSADYDEVKAAILRSYQLVPEAYRQRFRKYRKTDRQTYLEFAREKETLFARWCTAKEVDSLDDLRQLVLLEDFKNCLPSAVSTYLNERQPETLREAAVMADEYVLTHRISLTDRPRSEFLSAQPHSTDKVVPSSSNSEQACFYCKKQGHLVADCPVLKSPSSGRFRPANFVFRVSKIRIYEYANVAPPMSTPPVGYIGSCSNQSKLNTTCEI